jgi:endonuclease G
MIHPYWDMALLTVGGLPISAKPLPLSVTAPEALVGKDVIVVGYPARDYRNDLEVQDRVFQQKYGVKRMQPGKAQARERYRSFENLVNAMTHDSSTLGGNSGSALIDLATGTVVGLHFAGEYLKANYGVPTFELARDQRVVDAALNFQGRVEPTLAWGDSWLRTENTYESNKPKAVPAEPTPALQAPAQQPAAATANATYTFSVPGQVTVSVSVPLPAGTPQTANQPATPPPSAAEDDSAVEKVPKIYPDLDSREGYRDDFLELEDGVTVPMPRLTPAGEAVAARLDDGSPILKYENFSIVMHKKRRLALFTAANVDWRNNMRQVKGKKPSRKELNDFSDNAHEDWVIDSRIPLDHQLPDYFYRKSGAFDRGHLVRRDDVAWGKSFKEMQKGNGDTFHMTNCSPQTPELNRSNLGEFNWGALENMIQRQTRTEKVCIFSGPVLEDDDHYFHGLVKSGVTVSVQIPKRFWKIIVANHEGRPAAFGFVLDQDLAEVDLYEEFAIPDAWKQYLRPIAEIERYLFGLAKLTPFKRWDQFNADLETESVKTDSYLESSLEAMNQGGLESLDVETVSGKHPLLIKVKDPDQWRAPQGFEMQAQLGNIVSGSGTVEAIRKLENDANVLGLEASRDAGLLECTRSVPFVKANRIHDHNPSEKGDGALVAFIDTGIDVLHEAFLDSNIVSRVIEIWDQRDDTTQNRVTPRALYPSLTADYGHVHTAAAIQGYVPAKKVPDELGRDPQMHGTHVASIAAGRKVGKFGGGIAPEAKILLVIPRLKTAPDDPVSIGYSSSHVDALAYIKAAAHQRQKPVVVNVSLGMNAGSHDGTSFLETAFDAFSGGGREPGLVIVKSAGNERTLDGHAKMNVSSMGGDRLRWSSDASFRPEDTFELWFESCDEMSFRLRDPAGQVSEACSWSTPSVKGAFASGNSYRMVYTRYHKDCGDSRVLAVIQPGTAQQIGSGNWELQIAARKVLSAGVIHAWVERLNSRPVRFLNHQNEEMTLSIPGTARTVITVGAVGSEFPLLNTDTSSYGPTRDDRNKPDLVAPGQDIVAARAGTATGVIVLTGTSMAAPHVSGAVALVLSRAGKNGGGSASWPSASQVAAALRDTAQYFSGRHTPGTGFGMLDTAALFRALFAEDGYTPPADRPT